ncbi:hypothetical protein B4U80_08372 [Leptotrombidium deliense]|uniref:Secreted salivary gland peptide-like protein n=1 Tax=Leptotrombidium deliense TaxID=299467 RepID=A0A443SSB5_9ACAR|nr:hypothetical protein B4U80_08372 [Leptotrombidium deliense]
MKFFATVCLCIFIHTVVGQENGECKMTEKDFDDCTSLITTFGNRNIIIPSNDEELNTLCNNTFTALSCVRKYTRTCMGSFARTVTGIFSYDIKRILKKRCRDPEGRKEFLKHIRCGLPKERLEPLHKCMDNYVAQLQWSLDNVKKEDLVPTLCCTLHQTHQCFRTQASMLCDSVTGPETTKYFDQVMAHAIGEGVEYTCGVFKDLDSCNTSMKKEIWQPLYEIGKDAVKAGYTSKFSSPFTLAVKIFSKLN